LYKKALLPDGNQDKIKNFTGISDVFEIPQKADLILKTDSESVMLSTHKLYEFIVSAIS
jgi:adenylylsulfate kinase